jgi:DNA-binding NtrC family response regulator
MKLLRILQTGEFERLGSGETRKADVRTISATNSDLPEAIERGEFREDLYYRLNVIELRIPPLRERVEDIPPLVEHFIAQNPDASARQPSTRAWNALLEHDWPGNVRELENRIQRAVLLARSSEIEPEDLDLGNGARAVSEPGRSPSPTKSGADPETQEISAALEDANGVVAHAAKRLGLSRQALYRRMQRLGIDVERRPRRARN